jgi:hypothetical protein
VRGANVWLPTQKCRIEAEWLKTNYA